jgi:hypothetical protein
MSIPYKGLTLQLIYGTVATVPFFYDQDYKLKNNPTIIIWEETDGTVTTVPYNFFRGTKSLPFQNRIWFLINS